MNRVLPAEGHVSRGNRQTFAGPAQAVNGFVVAQRMSDVGRLRLPSGADPIAVATVEIHPLGAARLAESLATSRVSLSATTRNGRFVIANAFARITRRSNGPVE